MHWELKMNKIMVKNQRMLRKERNECMNEKIVLYTYLIGFFYLFKLQI